MPLLSRLCCLGLLLPGFAAAEAVEFRGARFFVYRFDPKVEKLELFLPGQGLDHSPTFQQLEKDLGRKGRRLKVAMNAGIYEPGFVPSGLHISEGKTIVPLNTSGPPPKTGPNDLTPNFYLLPNGVFYIRPDGTAAVRSTDWYAKAKEAPRLATQSGPLAVAAGKIHPVFQEQSTSRLLRNGIGVDSKGRVVMVASDRTPGLGRINLWGFAALFRDKLDCDYALYLDGDISRIFIRGETDTEVPRSNFFAGILAITEAVDAPGPGR